MQWDNELHLLPLPMGEVAERSEDGEGKQGCKALSVTFGDSSPKGGAKEGITRNGAYLYRYAPFIVLQPPIKRRGGTFRLRKEKIWKKNFL
mgnify:FL=1